MQILSNATELVVWFTLFRPPHQFTVIRQRRHVRCCHRIVEQYPTTQFSSHIVVRNLVAEARDCNICGRRRYNSAVPYTKPATDFALRNDYSALRRRRHIQCHRRIISKMEHGKTQICTMGFRLRVTASASSCFLRRGSRSL